MPRKGATMGVEQRAKISAAMKGRPNHPKGRHYKGRRNGDSTSLEYHTWKAMIYRCRNENHPRYRDYGGRGIRVCDAWLDYETFLTDMGRRPSASHSIDRINNNGNYEPGNCRWATPNEQASNRRCRVKHRVVETQRPRVKRRVVETQRRVDDCVSLPDVTLDDAMWPAAHLLLSVTTWHDASRTTLEMYAPVCSEMLDATGHDGYRAFVSYLAYETWRTARFSAYLHVDITPERVQAQWKRWSALRTLQLL